jgi:hypothetical protein
MLPPVYMLPPIPNLDVLTIRTPCTVSWNGMEGDDRVRFCSQCKLPVYNFTQFTRTEIEGILGSTPGRLCARLYRRPDGTIMTRECATGRRKRFRKLFAMPIALLAIFTGIFFCRPSSKTHHVAADAPPVEQLRQFEPFRTVMDLFDPPVQGEICINPPKSCGPTAPPPPPSKAE